MQIGFLKNTGCPIVTGLRNSNGNSDFVNHRTDIIAFVTKGKDI